MFLDSEVMKKIIYTNENLKYSWLVLRCVCVYVFILFSLQRIVCLFLCARVNNELYSFILPLLSLIANEKGCDINMFCCKIEKKNSSVLCLIFFRPTLTAFLILQKITIFVIN